MKEASTTYQKGTFELPMTRLDTLNGESWQAGGRPLGQSLPRIHRLDITISIPINGLSSLLSTFTFFVGRCLLHLALETPGGTG